MINTRVDLRKLVITCLVPVTALLIHNIVYLAGTRICDLTGSQTDSIGSITSCISYILCICIFGYLYLSDHSKTKHAGKKNPFLRAFVIFILLLILGISLQLLTTCILRLIDSYRPELLTSYHERVQRSFSIDNGIIRICTVTLLAPIAEEFAFRGVALKLSASAFHTKHAALCAILFTAFCFGCYHGNVVQFCYSVPAGIILGVSCRMVRLPDPRHDPSYDLKRFFLCNRKYSNLRLYTVGNHRNHLYPDYDLYEINKAVYLTD